MVENKKKRIVIAMSGGVDSSTSAALLKEQGYDVIGVSMQLWNRSEQKATDGRKFKTCCSLDDLYDARRVADKIGIPFYVLNFEEDFKKRVIDNFVEEYLLGHTPNPCVRCNQWIKFEPLMQKAKELEADYLATGHYARCEAQSDGWFRLLKGADKNKDQSYFLFTLKQDQLASTLFPLGNMTKPEVRALAAKFGLQTAEKKESQEICFVPDNDYAGFIEKFRSKAHNPGAIVDSQGNILGKHNGTYHYTIGQRKGLGLSHPTPLFVLGINADKNEVIVGNEQQLLQETLIAKEVNWIVPQPIGPIEATCKIRYRQEPVACRILPLADGQVEVSLAQPERAITPGQAIVFYQGEDVLGGGWIEMKRDERISGLERN